jgi:hypothetical protein
MTSNDDEKALFIASIRDWLSDRHDDPNDALFVLGEVVANYVCDLNPAGRGPAIRMVAEIAEKVLGYIEDESTDMVAPITISPKN